MIMLKLVILAGSYYEHFYTTTFNINTTLVVSTLNLVFLHTVQIHYDNWRIYFQG